MMFPAAQRIAGVVGTLVTGRPRHRYHAVVGDVDAPDSVQQPPRGAPRRRTAIAISAILGAALFVFLVVCLAVSEKSSSHSCDSLDAGYHCQTEISQFWGQYSPYFSVPSDISTDVPDQCVVTFAQVLSRHGSRDPTAGKSAKYRETIDYIHQHARAYRKALSFLKKYRYSLGADQLTAFGEQQLVNSGVKYYRRYRALAKGVVPFIRASGQDRVVVSAQKWAEGFHTARLADDDVSENDEYPYKIIVVAEGDAFNNTLSHRTCSQYDTSIANSEQEAWASIFVEPIAKRFSRLLRTELSREQTIYLMDLCPFETVAHIRGLPSRFCRLFTMDEWKQYDYYQSLGKYYGFSWGNPLGATQGVGFANELVARLTNSPVIDHTNTNSTLDGSEETFPLGVTTALYADFSHDNDMMSIFAALGLYNATLPLSNSTIATAEEMHGFSASWTVPFAARAYFEKIKCTDQDEEYVRVIVNDRVLPLDTCGGDALGRCTLSRFVDSLSFVRGGGDWDKCFA